MQKMGTPQTILLVDDEPHVRTYLKILLRQLRVPRFIEASNGDEAVRAYQAHRPDLVILDINMPGKDGLETLEELLKVDEEALVVMLTAQASRKMIEKSGESGAIHYIRKDTPKETMLHLFREIFNDIWGEAPTSS